VVEVAIIRVVRGPRCSLSALVNGTREFRFNVEEFILTPNGSARGHRHGGILLGCCRLRWNGARKLLSKAVTVSGSVRNLAFCIFYAVISDQVTGRRHGAFPSPNPDLTLPPRSTINDRDVRIRLGRVARCHLWSRELGTGNAQGTLTAWLDVFPGSMGWLLCLAWTDLERSRPVGGVRERQAQTAPLAWNNAHRTMPCLATKPFVSLLRQPSQLMIFFQHSPRLRFEPGKPQNTTQSS
jgi:hypothetical protein